MTGPRQYKNFTPRMGVYRIVHAPSGRILLGQSTHVEGMLNRVRFQLQLGVHTNRAMQRDWQEHGPESFTFEVLDELKPEHPGDEPVDDLRELLALWQERLNILPERQY